MFNQLGDRLKATLDDLRGRGRLTEDDVNKALRNVRVALLEADVALSVVKEFIEGIRKRALGKEVSRSVNPGHLVVKIVHDELVELMGKKNDALDLSVRPPAVILVTGLQGAGKTTTVGKLARYLHSLRGKRILVTSVDIYRPAAIDQLKRLAGEVEVAYCDVKLTDPMQMATDALEYAQTKGFDVLIIDTAGRLHVDQEMMIEVKNIKTAVNPTEILFIVDSMTGQDAINSAQAFNKELQLTGVILTKTDGDARGGAALSIRYQTGCAIKFIGTGEGNSDLEPFHPERIASRILGMGDVLTLVEEAERNVDREGVKRVARKLAKGKGFDLVDFREQLEQMHQMGGLSAIVDKLPGMGGLPAGALHQADNVNTKRLVAIINSMTPRERAYPALIKGARKRRIAGGSGTQVQEVNRLLKQFAQLQKIMKKAKGKRGLSQMMDQLKSSGGSPFG
ncbi:MAG: signal recognition particle protein [Acidiferrobacteraceae bacterium]|nr:signal recognition particle protein [Acidiferrobacteraceae bacterium]